MMNKNILSKIVLLCIVSIYSFGESLQINFDQIPDGSAETYISGFNFSNEKVIYNIHDDLAVYEADIILGTVEEMERRKESYENNDTNVSHSFVILGPITRWENGVIHYHIDPNIPSSMQTHIHNAIQEWEQNTLIRFIPIDPNTFNQNETYLEFKNSSGCSSSVGRLSYVHKQILDTHPSCGFAGMVHEIGHAVGLYHEQSRPDRDSYITVLWDNIADGWSSQFRKNTHSNTQPLGAYDYSSVMHYKAYIANKGGRPTMVAKNGATLGNRYLSAGDIDSVKKIYSTHIVTLIEPTLGTQLTSTSIVFQWTNSYGAEVYLRIKNSSGLVIYQGYQNSQAKIVNNLPSDGSTIHVELQTNTLDGWVTKNYTYIGYLAEPSNPSSSTINDIAFGSVTLTWHDNTSTEQGYRIYNGSTLIATLPANTTSYQLDNLVEGGSYTFTIKAFNSTGESEGLVVTFIKDANIAWLIPTIYYPILLAQ